MGMIRVIKPIFKLRQKPKINIVQTALKWNRLKQHRTMN